MIYAVTFAIAGLGAYACWGLLRSKPEPPIRIYSYWRITAMIRCDCCDCEGLYTRTLAAPNQLEAVRRYSEFVREDGCWVSSFEGIQRIDFTTEGSPQYETDDV